MLAMEVDTVTQFNVVSAPKTATFQGKSRDFNAGMAEKTPQDCIGLG